MQGLADPATEPWLVWFNEQLQLLPDFITVENSPLFPWPAPFNKHLESTRYTVPSSLGRRRTAALIIMMPAWLY